LEQETRSKRGIAGGIFFELLSSEELGSDRKNARVTQKIDDGIEAQRRVVEVPADEWKRILQELSKQRLLTPKETGVLRLQPDSHEVSFRKAVAYSDGDYGESSIRRSGRRGTRRRECLGFSVTNSEPPSFGVRPNPLSIVPLAGVSRFRVPPLAALS
jgi:hypothetical protein